MIITKFRNFLSINENIHEIEQYHIDDFVKAMRLKESGIKFLFDEYEDHYLKFEILTEPEYYRITEYGKEDGKLINLESYGSPNLEDVIFDFKEKVKPTSI